MKNLWFYNLKLEESNEKSCCWWSVNLVCGDLNCSYWGGLKLRKLVVNDWDHVFPRLVFREWWEVGGSLKWHVPVWWILLELSLVVIYIVWTVFVQHYNSVAFSLSIVLFRENHNINAVCFPTFYSGCSPACEVWCRVRTGE